MKILLVSNMYPSVRYPHYGVFVQNTEKILAQAPGVKLGKAVLRKQDSKLGKLWGYLRFYAQILCKGLFGRYDVIYAHFLSHVTLPLLPVLALNRRVRLVLNAHGNDVIADTPADDKWVRLSRRIAPKADHIIVPSRYFQTLMEQSFGISSQKLLVYPSGGIDPQVFFPQDRDRCLAALQLEPDKRYIGYVSRIEADKGWDTFLRMAAALSHREDLRFIVVGGGTEQEAFDSLTQTLGLSRQLIRFPLLSQKQIAQIFSLLDVFCFPTRRKSESLGLVGLEAMACGCPVVASDAGGPSSYMEHGINGFVFSSSTPEDCIRQVEQALSLTAEERAHLHKGMAETVSRYTTDTVNAVLLRFFESLSR